MVDVNDDAVDLTVMIDFRLGDIEEVYRVYGGSDVVWFCFGSKRGGDGCEDIAAMECRAYRMTEQCGICNLPDGFDRYGSAQQCDKSVIGHQEQLVCGFGEDDFPLGSHTGIDDGDVYCFGRV